MIVSLFHILMVYQVMAKLGSLWSGPTVCRPALQRVMQCWVDAVWPFSLRSGPTLWGPVLQSVVYAVIVGFVVSGRTSCGRVLQWLVQSWADAVWSSSLLSRPTLCGLVLQWAFCVVIVSIVFIDPGDTPGGSQTLFVVRS